MIQNIFNVIVGTAVLALVYLSVLAPSFGTAMYERHKWIGEYFAVGSSEQLTVDSDGDLVTTGDISGVDDLSLTGNEFTTNGVTWKTERQTLATGTTTICALQSPSATSTLENATVHFTTSSTSASTITVAKATTAFATTTSVGQDIALGANAFGTINASTTAAQKVNAVDTFAPSTWLTVGMKGGTGTFSPTGACTATWRSVI